MSWSVGGTGKASEVRQQIADAFTKSKCEEPEEGIRLGAAALIDKSLESQPPEKTVSVSAFGSQSKDFTTGEVRNSLSIKIEPQGS
jgi:hypothetical protein